MIFRGFLIWMASSLPGRLLFRKFTSLSLISPQVNPQAQMVYTDFYHFFYQLLESTFFLQSIFFFPILCFLPLGVRLSLPLSPGRRIRYWSLIIALSHFATFASKLIPKFLQVVLKLFFLTLLAKNKLFLFFIAVLLIIL